MTNGDIIRAMNDEQLVKMFLLHDFHTYRHCPTDDCAEQCNPKTDSECDCEKCWLAWMKHQVRPIITETSLHGEKVLEYKFEISAVLE